MLPKLPEPIPNWRQLPRFRSAQFALPLVLLSAVQADWLPLLRPLIPAEHWPAVTAVIGLLILVVRGLVQRGLPAEPPPAAGPATPAEPADDEASHWGRP